ncbi:MAG: hypothetical protein ACYC46_08050 [Acidobacteriaceae bacterium]
MKLLSLYSRKVLFGAIMLVVVPATVCAQSGNPTSTQPHTEAVADANPLPDSPALQTASSSTSAGSQPEQDRPEVNNPTGPVNPDDQKILKVLPNYKTVDPSQHPGPMSVQGKFRLVEKELFQPVTLFTASYNAALAQAEDTDPKYGQGWGPYAQRFGAAITRESTQTLFSDAVFPILLREDPRYYREGNEYSFLHRSLYAASRVVITRTDAGRNVPNFAMFAGRASAAALTQLYYPPASQSGSAVYMGVVNALGGVALNNLVREFWPEIRRNILHERGN